MVTGGTGARGGAVVDGKPEMPGHGGGAVVDGNWDVRRANTRGFDCGRHSPRGLHWRFYKVIKWDFTPR